MPAPAVVVPVARVAARPILTALARQLAKLEPLAARVAAMLARMGGGFKDLVAKTFTIEKIQAAIGKVTPWVTVADALSRLGVSLAKVKGQVVEAATGFGLFGQAKAGPQEAVAAAAAPPPVPPEGPPSQQVTVAVADGGAAETIQQAGEESEKAAQKVLSFQGVLSGLGELGFGPAGEAAKLFGTPLEAVSTAIDGLQAVTETASNFDQLQLSLETLLGSTEHAGQAFQMLSDFAGRTPFSLESATEAFRQLWTAGIKPTEENLTAFGNVAGAFGKDITAVTSAISGVDLGNLDGLKDLGFQAEAQGNKLKVTFQGVTTTIGNSSEAVAGYLEKMGTTQFAGGIERQANTFTTGFDQIKKAFAALLAAVGGAGLLTALESMDGSLARILKAALPVAEVLGKGLGVAMGGAAKAAEFLAEHAGVVASLLAGLSATAAVSAMSQFVEGLSGAKTAVLALGKAMLANPVGLIVGAIAAVVAALVIYKDEMVTVGGTTATVGEWMRAAWEVTKDRLAAVWEKVKEAWAGLRDFLVDSWAVIRDTVAGGVQSIQSFLADFVAGAAEILGGLGRILGAVFGALVDGIKAGINFMIAAIASVPQAVGAAVEAIEEGDFAGIFTRIREATAGNFDKDFLGDLLGGLGDRIGSLATTVTDVVRFTAEGIKDDVVGFGRDIAATAEQLAATRPEENGGLPDPNGGGTDFDDSALIQQVEKALQAVRDSVGAANAAFQDLKAAPLAQVAEKYKAFDEAAQAAGKTLKAQRAILEQLPQKHAAVAKALAAVAEAEAELNRQSRVASNLRDTAESLVGVENSAQTTTKALQELQGASIADLHKAYEAFNTAAQATSKTIEDARKRFQTLEDVEGEVAKATQELDEATNELGEEQKAAAGVFGNFTKEALGAAAALYELTKAQTPEEAQEKAADFRAEMENLRTSILAAQQALLTLGPGPQFHETSEKLKQMQGEFTTLSDAGVAWGVKLAESAQTATDGMSEHFQGFVDGVTKAFDAALVDLFKGSTDGFEELFDNVADMFAEMLAKMVSDWLKAQLFQQTGAPGQTGGANFQAFQGSINAGGVSGYTNAAFLGAGIGAYGSSALGGDANTGAVLGSVGSIIGAYVGQGAAVGGFWGAVIGAVVGALVAAFISQKPEMKGYADIAVRDGKAVIDGIRTQGKADVGQLKKFAEGVADAINEIVALSGGALVSLSKITLGTKDNKFYRVIDAAGITHKFGEDLKAATDYAVLQALKGAELEGLSPEVQAAFKNTLATTVEELASDVEFAAMVRDLDLEPVTADLRKLMQTFNSMTERARALGISLEKVDDAFNKAVQDMKKNFEAGLKPFQEAGLTDVEREARRISEAFEEMRENARLFNEELARETESRNEQITQLQEELARQQQLLEAAQRVPVIPPEVAEQLAALGLEIPRFFREDMTASIEEAIKKLIDEIARLQNLNAEQTPIDTTAIDDAERAARQALRERVRDSLKPYLRLNLTDVQQQLRELDDTFEKLRRDARAAGVSMGEVNTAYQRAREEIRKQVMDQLQPFLDLAAGMTPLQVELRELEKRFADMRTNAGELGISLDEVERAEQAARDQLKKQFEDELAAFGGENPFVAQLDDLKDKFEELKKNAIALGLGTDEVNAAYERALDLLQRQFQDGIQGYLDYGRGLSEIAVRHRDLTRFFEEQREAARALDEAQGGTTNQDLLAEAEAAAFRQLVDEFKDSLQDLRDAGLSPTEIAVREMRDRFEQLRGDAVLLGLSLEELTRLEIEALQRLRGELDSQLDRYLLSDEEQQQRALEDEFLNYLRDAFALYTYEPGGEAPEPEIFPGANELEVAFDEVQTASKELAQAFRELHGAMVPGSPYAPGGPEDPYAPDPDGGPAGLTPGEMVASLLDFLKPLREGRGMDDLPEEQKTAIDAASTQVSLLLEQLRLGMTDDVGALQGALANLTTLLQESGVEMDESLLALTETLATGDIPAFLEELRDGVLGSADGFAGLIDILLSGSGLSLPDLMHQLATGTFDAIQAMLGLTEIPPELADVLKKIGLAYEAAQRDVRQRGSAGIDRGDSANREVEQRERDLENLLRQLEQFEDLALSPLQRDLKKLNEQFDEMRANARRLGVSMERVEAAYQLALEERRKTFLEQLRPFEELGMSPAERELAALNKQFDEMRANAALLGISLDRVEAAYGQAIDDFWERLLGPLHEFREGLELSELSTLTPQERLAEAQARFQDLAARALAGDLEAAQQLQGAAQTLLQEGRGFYASGEGYQDLFALVTGTIDQILGSLAPGLFPPPPAAGATGIAGIAEIAGFDALLAAAGWGYQDALAARGIPFATYPGDTLGLEPGEVPLVRGTGATDRPSLAVDLSGVREGNAALREELRLARQQEHADALELHKRVDQQSEELREVRALLRRLTSNTQYGGRAQ